MYDGYRVDSAGVKYTDDPTRRWVSGYVTYTEPRATYSMPVISEIIPGLWMGGVEPGLVIPDFIEHVISLFSPGGYSKRHPLKSHLFVEMEDSYDQPLDMACDIAGWAYDLKGPILIHCSMGLNRSGLITAIYLVYQGWTADEAINLIREKRSPAALCNPHFEEYVRRFDEIGAEVQKR